MAVATQYPLPSVVANTAVAGLEPPSPLGLPNALAEFEDQTVPSAKRIH